MYTSYQPSTAPLQCNTAALPEEFLYMQLIMITFEQGIAINRPVDPFSVSYEFSPDDIWDIQPLHVCIDYKEPESQLLPTPGPVVGGQGGAPGHEWHLL